MNPFRYFIVVQGSPVRADIGPYIQMCLEDAFSGTPHAKVLSIFRGDAARAILNRHGKHSQYQLYHATAAQRREWGIVGQPDAPGHSSHELFSDGNPFYGVPDGQPLAWWQQGFDVLDADANAVISAAKHKGWDLARPYGSGVEFHHLVFKEKPQRLPLGSAEWGRIMRIRTTYPRR